MTQSDNGGDGGGGIGPNPRTQANNAMRRSYNCWISTRRSASAKLWPGKWELESVSLISAQDPAYRGLRMGVRGLNIPVIKIIMKKDSMMLGGMLERS